MNPNVDFYFSKAKLPAGKAGKWQEELEQLRMIVLDCGLTEELKLGAPCYTFQTCLAARQKSNIVLIHVFKEYCALLFFKGALLNDANGILIHYPECKILGYGTISIYDRLVLIETSNLHLYLSALFKFWFFGNQVHN